MKFSAQTLPASWTKALELSGKIHFLGLMLTVVLVLAYFVLPPNREVLHPDRAYPTQLYGYEHPRTGSSVSWIDKKSHRYQCDFQEGNQYGCGFSLITAEDFTNGIDISAYSAIEFQLDYQGPAKRIRFFLRNFNDQYASPGIGETNKFMSMSLRVSEVSAGQVLISLNEFYVADWWLKQADVRRQWADVEFNNLVEFGVDHPQVGSHIVELKKISLVGEWISRQGLYIAIIGIWMSVIVIDVVLGLYRVKRSMRDRKLTIHAMENVQSALEREKEDLELLYKTDPLTGVANRAGLEEIVAEQKHLTHALVLVDIDLFKEVNDRYGHDTGDELLREFSSYMVKQIQHEEGSVSRWGGEEFALIYPSYGPGNDLKLKQHLDTLRQNIATKHFCQNHKFTITVSMGYAYKHQSEKFEKTFKRADEALYRAKAKGRNCVVAGKES